MKRSLFSDEIIVNIFEWNDKYKIGIEEVDNQHKTLFALAFELNKAMLEKRSNEIQEQLLENLMNYTQTHFKVEEQYFQKYGYPKAREHVAMHNNLIQEVAKLKMDHENKKFGISIYLLKFLREWLSKHILVSDMEYGKFLKTKGVN